MIVAHVPCDTFHTGFPCVACGALIPPQAVDTHRVDCHTCQQVHTCKDPHAAHAS